MDLDRVDVCTYLEDKGYSAVMEMPIENDEVFDQQVQHLIQLIEQFEQKTKNYKISDPLIDLLCRVKEELPLQSSSWVHANYSSVLNPETFIITARNSFRQTARFWWLDALDIIRNLLILTPILFTWLALSQASSAYMRALAIQPDLKYSQFLMLWQSDFAGQLQPFAGFLSLRLSDVALLDVILIFLVILLSGAVHIFRDRHLERQESAIIELAGDLNTLLWQLDRINILYRQYHYENAEQRATQLLVNIDHYILEVRHHIVSVIADLKVEEKKLFERSHETQNQFAQKQATYLESFAIEHKNVVEQTSEQIRTIVTQQQALYTEWLHKLQSAVSSVTEQVQVIEQKHGELTASLVTQQRDLLISAGAHLELINQQQQKMLEGVTQTQVSIVEQGNQIRQSTVDLRETAAIFRHSIDDLGKFLPSLNQSLNTFNQSTTILSEETGKINTDQNRMVDALQSMEAMIAVFEKIMGQLVGQMHASANQLSQVYGIASTQLDRFNDLLDQANGSNGALVDLAEKLQGTMAQNHQDQGNLQDLLKQVISPLADVSQSAQSILPLFPTIQTAVKEIEESIAHQSNIRNEQKQDRLIDRENHVKMGSQLLGVEDALGIVSRDIQKFFVLLQGFETVFTQLSTNSGVMVERLSQQQNFTLPITSSTGESQETSSNDGNGHHPTPIEGLNYEHRE